MDIFQRFFVKIVDLCQDAGLVWGRELYFDGTKVEANWSAPHFPDQWQREVERRAVDSPEAEDGDATGTDA